MSAYVQIKFVSMLISCPSRWPNMKLVRKMMVGAGGCWWVLVGVFDLHLKGF